MQLYVFSYPRNCFTCKWLCNQNLTMRNAPNIWPQCQSAFQLRVQDNARDDQQSPRHHGKQTWIRPQSHLWSWRSLTLTWSTGPTALPDVQPTCLTSHPSSMARWVMRRPLQMWRFGVLRLILPHITLSRSHQKLSRPPSCHHQQSQLLYRLPGSPTPLLYIISVPFLFHTPFVLSSNKIRHSIRSISSYLVLHWANLLSIPVQHILAIRCLPSCVLLTNLSMLFNSVSKCVNAMRRRKLYSLSCLFGIHLCWEWRYSRQMGNT